MSENKFFHEGALKTVKQAADKQAAVESLEYTNERISQVYEDMTEMAQKLDAEFGHLKARQDGDSEQAANEIIEVNKYLKELRTKIRGVELQTIWQWLYATVALGMAMTALSGCTGSMKTIYTKPYAYKVVSREGEMCRHLYHEIHAKGTAEVYGPPCQVRIEYLGKDN